VTAAVATDHPEVPEVGPPHEFNRESDEALRAAATMVVLLPDPEATTRLLEMFMEAQARRQPPPSRFEYIREAYCEYAWNIHFAWEQVGDHLRHAMRTLKAEGLGVD